MNRNLLLIGLGMLLVTALVGIFLSQVGEPEVEQPIAFNHKKHIDNGLTCSVCHQYVEKYASAGLPKGEICLLCHMVPLSENPEEQKVRDYAERGEEIPWKRVYKLADHAYFSHMRHVTLGKVECVACHGNMPERSTPLTRPIVKMTMDFCLNCHEQTKASRDCIACHR